MSQAYRTADVLAYLRAEWDAATGDDELEPGLGDRLLRKVADRFPGILGPQALEAIKALDHELDAEAEAAEREDAALAAAVAICERHGIPADMTMSEGLRLAASRGDIEAAAFLAQANAPDRRVEAALWKAAAEAHPAWSCHGGGYVLDEDQPGPRSLDALTDWYQLTHPREALAIEEQVRAEG